MPVPPATTDPRFEDALKAESIIEKMPDSSFGYRALALAYIRLSRETGDPTFSDKALTSIDSGLEKQSDDQTLLKLKATVLLSLHEFGQGRDIGLALEKQLPQDPFVMGILTDANAELGEYKVAAKYAQKMVDTRPNSQSYAPTHEPLISVHYLGITTVRPRFTFWPLRRLIRLIVSRSIWRCEPDREMRESDITPE